MHSPFLQLGDPALQRLDRLRDGGLQRGKIKLVRDRAVTGTLPALLVGVCSGGDGVSVAVLDIRVSLSGVISEEGSRGGERVTGLRSVLKTEGRSASGGGESNAASDGCWDGLSHGHSTIFKIRMSMSNNFLLECRVITSLPSYHDSFLTVYGVPRCE